MRQSYKRRPSDFKRRIIKTNIDSKASLIAEEYKFLSMIKKEEFGTKYYNFRNNAGLTSANTGKRHSEESRKKMSEAQKKNPTKYWKGKSRSDETKQKISEAKRGKPQSDEHKMKNSSKVKELWTNPVWREKMLIARRSKA
jgi:hypothetical protein